MSSQLTARYRTARHELDLCVIEGLHAIKHAIRFGAEIIEIHGSHDGAWRELAHSHAADIEDAILSSVIELPQQVFRDLSPQSHPTGIIAIARRRLANMDEFWSASRQGPVVILDRPAHAGNIGAVIRTAAAANAAAVFTTGDLDPWHPSTIRGAAGLHFALTVSRLDEADLPNQHMTGLAASGEPLEQATLDSSGIFVLGSERHGLSESMSKRVAQYVALYMQPGVSSLNLAASAAILLYSLKSQTAQ